MKYLVKRFGLSEGFTEKELKRRYRYLVRKYHPDNVSTGDMEKFILIQRIYEHLLERVGFGVEIDPCDIFKVRRCR